MAQQHNGSTFRISPEEYESLFSGKKEKALTQALDIRKFEIELYWKRATYFWTFIAATLTGYFAVQSIDATKLQHQDLFLLILSSLGMVFSVAWFFVNKGSKYWQENWEKHVDVLEDDVTGPLYKVILSRNEDMTIGERSVDFLTGPGIFSVSKINQLISAYVAVLWIGLWLFSLFSIFQKWGKVDDQWLFLLVMISSVITILLFTGIGKRHSGGLWHLATIRKSRIKPLKVREIDNHKCSMNIKFWILVIIWVSSGFVASKFDVDVDPTWVLMIPAGIFLGGSAFAVFLMLDNFRSVLTCVPMFIFFVLALLSVGAFVVLGLNKEFSGLWNLWFLLVPYIFGRFYFGTNICKEK